METAPRATARSAWLYRLWQPGLSGVSVGGETLRVDAGARVAAEIPIGSVDAIEVRRSWFWHRLTIRTADGVRHTIGGLDEPSALTVVEAARAAAAHCASTIGPELLRVDTALRRFLDGGRYARRSAVGTLDEELASVVQECHGAFARDHLPPQAADALRRLAPLEPAGAFEAASARANERFAAERVPAVQAAAHTALRVALTDEQALAIATEEDATLVLAGAGTGKTAVIIGKVAHLVRNEGVPPEEILVLAFNAAAAEEVRRRLPADLKAANVFTFHAFGRRVIADTDVAPTISRLAQDDAAFQRAVDEALQDLLGDPRQSGVVTDFVTHHRAPYRSPFSFNSAGEYYEYVRSAELRTLSGDLVKSVEELEIANFLTLNGVAFRYEQQFPERTATQEYSQYRPDFYLPAHDIYIEHFALDENCRPPPTWKRYAEGVEWKRAIHAELGTRLIETYSWQHREGVLRDTLRKKLEAEGVAFEPIPIRSVIARLGRWLISWLARLLTTFLHHVKTSGASPAELRDRARASSDRARAESFLAVFEQVRQRYEAMLAEENAVDFHDLINRAAALIREGAWQASYRHILVDEFQDISAGRMATDRSAEGAGRPRTSSSATTGSRSTASQGATWGSCGTAGTTSATCGSARSARRSASPTASCGPRRPSCSATPRRRSARCGRLARTATRASPSSPTAIPAAASGARCRTSRSAPQPTATTRPPCWSSAATGTARAPRRASHRCASSSARCTARRAARPTTPSCSTSRTSAAASRHRSRTTRCWTSCSPRVPATGFPHAEERRLFYVAMTRARRGAYLVTDPQRFRRRSSPSCAATAPICASSASSPATTRRSALAASGASSSRSQSGNNLRCSNHPMCRHLAPRCANCNAGYAVPARGRARCTNASCARPPAACPTCGVGVLVTRYGRYGQFLRCTEYTSDPPCTHTENLPRRSARMRA